MGQVLSGLFEVLASVIFVLAFAWVARALLGAREMTLWRLALAALAGIGAGSSVAAFLIIDDIRDAGQLENFPLVAFPFQVIATMGAIVVLEVLFSRPRRERSGPAFRPLRSIRLSFGIARRAVQVSRIAARHGLGPLVGLGRRGGPVHSSEDLARRARMALEEAGGMFVKLGQLLATRPDLLPPEAQAELARLHSSASPLDRGVVEELIEDELGRPMSEVFAEVESDPLGSASIAQAHGGTLADGSPVVIKVRRPHLRDVVSRDLAITRWLARGAARRTSWGEAFDVVGLADEFGDALEDELDFRTEAKNFEEVRRASLDQPLVQVPRVYTHLTTSGLAVMERLDGTPLSQVPAEQVRDGRLLADGLTRSQVGAMMAGERFHGDPHPGNILLLTDGRLGLIDLGISGRLDAFERASVFQMLVAIRLEQPTLLYESMVSIGAVDPAVHDPGTIERAFARFMAAYLGPGLPPPEALTDLMRLATELGLHLPRSTLAMFRALATLTGTLEHLSPDYPVIDAIAELGGDEFRRRMMPESVTQFVQEEWAQLGPLVGRLPRHVDRIATMLEHGRLAARLRLFSEPEDRGFVERMVNRFVLSLLSIGSGIVSVMLLSVQDDRTFALFENLGLYEVLGWIGLFIAVTLLLRVLLAVLRSEGESRRR